MKQIKYFVFPAGKPEEKFEVLPHTFGDVNEDGLSDVVFVKVGDNWETPAETFTWTNANQDGAFVNNEILQTDITGTYDIIKEEIEVTE